MSLRTMQDWAARQVSVVAALVAYAYSLWDFLVGNKFFAVDFYHKHLTFELAYRSLAQDGTMPTWLPVFQGGRATFIDMANSFSPFGLDFLLAYTLTKPLGLDETLGMMTIHTWMVVLLNVLLAIGCRLFAREVLVSRHSADLVFILVLFSGGFSLARNPLLVLCSLFAPWFLLYLLRLVKQGTGRFIHNLAGLTLASLLGGFHQFNSASSAVLPYLAIFAVGLWVSGYGGNIGRGLKSALGSWPSAAALGLMLITLIVSVMPLAWEYTYFKAHNAKALYKGDSPQTILAHVEGGSRYTAEEYHFLRFEWQRLLSYVFPAPSTLERVTTVSNGMAAATVHSFHYFGMLGAALIVVGLVAGGNPYLFPIVFTIVTYGTFMAVDQSPIFMTVINAGYPITRHLFFADLHLVPLVALLAGMGMDVILRLGRLRPMPVRLWLMTMRWHKGWAVVMALSVATLLCAILSAVILVRSGEAVSAFQGLLLSLSLGIAAVAVVGFSFIAPRPALSVILIFAAVLLDLTASQQPAHRFAIAGEHAASRALPNDHPGYDSPLTELDVLNAYAPLAPLHPEAYAYRDKPSLYHRFLYRYWFIGSRTFYDIMAHSSPEAWDLISGFTRPRLTLVDHAVSDPSGELARRSFGTAQGAESLLQRIFVHDDRSAEPSDAIGLSGASLDGAQSLPLVKSVRHLHDLDSTKIRTNNPGLVRTLIGKENLPSSIQVGREPAVQRERTVGSNRALWWIMIDFGPGRQEVINLLAGPYPLPFERGRLFLDASHDGTTWLSTKDEPLAFDQLGWRGMPLDKREWHAWNDGAYRYYKLIIDPGSPIMDPEVISAFRLGYTARAVTDVRYRTVQTRLPLKEFSRQPKQDDSRFQVLSLPLPQGMATEISSHPAYRFWYQFALTLQDQTGGSQPLTPTWKNDWYRAGLFQVNYRMNGRLSVTVPTEAMAHPEDWLVDVTMRMPETGVEVQSFGANHLKAAVHRERDGWLYYADTWDPYWQATLDGGPVSVYRANLQYKAVPVPAGDHVVEFRHHPLSFLRLIEVSYLLQGATIGLWIWTARRSRNLVDQA